MSAECTHESVTSVVKIVKYEEYTATNPDHRMAEIEIYCRTCMCRAAFRTRVGGLAPDEPRTSVDCEELRAPFVWKPPT